MSDYRAPSPTRPIRQTVHIPGVVVPAVDSDNESDCVSSLSTFSLDLNMTGGYGRKGTNTAIKLLQNGGKVGRGAPPALLPGAGLVMAPKVCVAVCECECGCVTGCVVALSVLTSLLVMALVFGSDSMLLCVSVGWDCWVCNLMLWVFADGRSLLNVWTVYR